MTKKADAKVETVKERPKCFVIMPISDPEGYKLGHFRRVYEDIYVPACENAGFIPDRADQNKATNLIQLEILRELIDAEMAICDLSTRNPNVLFELGIRQAFDKPTILVQEFGTEKIFDITGLRFSQYDGELSYRGVMEARSEISEALQLTQAECSKGTTINSLIKLLGLRDAAKIPIHGKMSETDAVLAYLRSLDDRIGEVQNFIQKMMPSSELNKSSFNKEKTLSGRVIFDDGILSRKLKFSRNISSDVVNNIRFGKLPDDLRDEVNKILTEQRRIEGVEGRDGVDEPDD